jgi:uncharacterized repeat protein (TIGR01451 family)
MTRVGRRLCLMLLAACLCGAASGCFGVTQNPSYFPYYLPFGDVIQTHAKPPWPGYYANFDPKAIRLVVQPLEATSQVRTQYVVLATVYDDKNVPRRGRRVDWTVDGPGSIVEVDESGVFPGRGYKVGTKQAVSYTSYHENRLTRGNANAADDVMVRPGQTWCVVTSPEEGDTHLTLVAPGIYDWDRRVVHAVIRWVDATWEFPPPARARFGTEQVLVTKVFRATDRRPLKGYEVRYKILDGPPAQFKQNGAQEFTALSHDLTGIAQATLVQAAPSAGINRVSIEIVRPPDPSTPSGAGVPIVRTETTVEWQAPNVALSHSAAPSVGLNQEIAFTTKATNSGTVESSFLTITEPVPEGLEFVRAQPPAARLGESYAWTFGVLAPGQEHTVQAVYRARRAGTIHSLALLTTAEGQKDQKEAVVQVSTPQLTMALDAPLTGAVGTPIPFTLTLNNPGSGPLDEIFLVAKLPPGLEYADPAGKGWKESDTLSVKVPGLAAGQSRAEKLELRPARAGRYNVLVTATASGLSAQAERTVDVTEPKVSFEINGPQKRVVGRPAEWQLSVSNPTGAPLSNVVVRDRLPPELEFQTAPQGGVFQNGEVVWNIGTLMPNEKRVLDLVTLASRPAALAEHRAEVTADGLRREAKATIEIEGKAALTANLSALNNPVEVGKTVVYRLEIINQGSAPLNRIEITASSEELKPVKAQGPSRETIAARTVKFDVVNGVQPGSKVTYFIECEAEKAGDARLKVEVTSEITPQALVREEATRIIVPFPATPPPPPGGGLPMPLPPG